MRKFYQNSVFLEELEMDFFAPLNNNLAAPLLGPLFMETDDYAGDTSTTGVVTIVNDIVSITGQHEASGDSDWFSFNLLSGQGIEITGEYEHEVSFYDSVGSLIATDDRYYNGSNYSSVFSTFTEGTFYVAIENRYNDLGVYGLSGSIFTDDYSNDISTTGIVGVENNLISISGSLETRADEDWFSFDLLSGQGIEISASSSYEISFYDENGVAVEADGDYYANGNLTTVFSTFTAGTYFASIGTRSYNYAGQYDLSGVLFEDDYADDNLTTGTLDPNGSVTGVLETAADSDWFEITLQANERLIITSDITRYNVGEITFRDADGNYLLEGVTTSTSNNTLEFVYLSNTASTYYIDVSAYYNVAPNTSFTLMATSEIVDPDLAGGTSTLGILPLGGSVQSVFDFRYDDDWFAFEVTEANQSISFDVDTDATVGFTIHTETGGYHAGSRSAVFETAGTYFVSLEVTGNFTTDPYTLTASVNPNDIPADTTTSATIVLGETVSGLIDDSSDADWFRISLDAGESVRFEAAYTDGSVSYPSVFVYASNGSFVGGENGAVNIIPSETGDYFVSVIGAANNGVQAYDLLARYTPEDIAGNTSTTATISPGETVEGVIHFNGDSDWFQFDYVAGETFRFDIEVFSRNNEILRFYDESNNIVDVEVQDGRGYFTSEADGPYYASVSVSGSGVPTYNLSAVAVEADVAGDLTTTASLIIGEIAAGSVNSRYDRDWFRFEVELGQAIDFEVLTTEGGRNLDLQIFDSSGNRVDYNSNNSLIFVAETAGTFFLEVEGDYSGFPDYEITSTEIIDDYAANANTTGVIIGGESLNFLLEYIEDIDWIKLGGTDGDVLRLSVDPSLGHDISIIDESGVTVGESYYDSELETYVIDFAVSTTTDYFLRLSYDSYGHDPDTVYTITAEAIDDDYIGNAQTLESLSLGNMTSVSHDFFGDQEWFSYSAVEGQSLLLSYVFPEANPNSYVTISGIVNVHNEAGDILYTQSVGNGSSNNYPYVSLVNDFAFTFDATGIYYISSQLNGLDFGQAYSFTSDLITVNGTVNPDVLTGTEIDDVIFGDFGDDTLIGGLGDDLLNGGEGRDNLIGGQGADVLNGGGGEDAAVYSTAESGAIVNLSTGFGGAGSSAESDSYISIENIIGSAFDDALIGNDERNDISAGAGDDYIFGDAGDVDYLFGNAGNDTIDGGEGFDYIIGGMGADTLTGGEGNDQFDYDYFGEFDGDVITDFALGRDRLDFTSLIYQEGVLPIYIGDAEFTGQRGEIRFEISGNDTLIQLDSDGDGVANEYLTLQNYTDELFYVGNGDIYGVSVINGDENDNSLYGASFAERFYGMEGNDYISAEGGNDFADGGSGDDRIYGREGDDDLNGGDGLDYVYGNEGNDILRGEAGTNYLIDEEGQNIFMLTGGMNIVTGNSQSVIDFSEASIGAVADLMMTVTNSGAAEGDSYSGVDNITGSGFADRLFGDNDANILIGGDGNDALFGRNGDDIFIGGNGRDIFSGGNGFDTVDYSVETGAVTVDMMERIVASQAAEGDRLYSIESVIGTDFNDRIFGNNDDNLIEGGSGNDSLFGRNGSDIINGGDGDDLVSAGAHDDILNGGVGNDRLYTGTGNDVVVIDTAIGGNDTVYDFMTGFDKILIDDESGNFDSFSELMAAGVDNGADVTFDFGDGNTLTIKGYNLADLSAADFDFGDAPPAGEFIDNELYASNEFTASDSFDWDAI